MGLCWRHVDFETGLIEIEQQADAKAEIARLKTETAYRRIEAPDWLMSMLAAVKLASSYSAPDDLVFCTRTGKPHRHGNVLGRGLYPALKRAGLPQTSFHSLRHSHASLWIKDGGDVITLSKRLGHATPQVTMSTYADDIERPTTTRSAGRASTPCSRARGWQRAWQPQTAASRSRPQSRQAARSCLWRQRVAGRSTPQ
ncbi:MAG: hypothetical protein QOG70_2966 [Solirubrobacteraceae bacterium]|nr:hypothetical protein [Solirubrobacteraceae bacterium]